MPSQNMPFWCKDYFQLEVMKNQQMQEEFFAFLFFCLKAGHKFPFVKMSPTSQEEESPHITGDKRSTPKQVCANKPY